VFFRAFGEGGVGVPLQFQASANNGVPQDVEKTPRMHFELGLEWGAWFP
jgi:hypothetical protein